MLSTRMLMGSSGLGGYSASPIPIYTENVSTGNVMSGVVAGGPNPIIWNHTISSAGSNILLTVFVGLTDAIGPVSGVTFSGSALTNSGAISAGIGNYPRSEIWYLLSPPITTGSIVVTLPGGNNYASAVSVDWNGVNQATPLGAFTSGSALAATSVSGPVDGIPLSVFATGVCYWNNGANVLAVGQEQIGSASADGAWKLNVGNGLVGYSPVSVGWSIASSTNMALGIVIIHSA
jgi:hypothetical protein